jgi:hypothetical protein
MTVSRKSSLKRNKQRTQRTLKKSRKVTQVTLHKVSNALTKTLLEECNKLNEGLEGVGDATDSLALKDMKHWDIYDVKKNYKLGSATITYQLYHRKLNNKATTPLFVIPGFSTKSIYWTVGRINKYINDYPTKFNKYQCVYIINLENVKIAQKAIVGKEMTRDVFDEEVVKHVDDVFDILYKKYNTKITVLSRSAGGGLAIELAIYNAKVNKFNKQNHKMKALYLMAPGGKKTGMVDFVKYVKTLPVYLGYVKQDTRVHPDEIALKVKQMRDSKYKKFQYIEINNPNTARQGDRFNHRFQPELIAKL